MSDNDLVRVAIEKAEQTLGETPGYSVMHRGRFALTLERLMEKVRPGSTVQVADVGVWPGYQSLALEQLGYDVTGFDLHPERLKPMPFPVVQQDLNTEPCLKAEPGSFDAVMATEIIEHIQPQMLSKFVAGLHEALRPGGWAMITTPNRGAIGARLRPRAHGTDADGHGHTKEYTANELRGFFNSGWTNVHITTIEAYRGVGLAGPDQYYRPLSQWWRHPRRVHNLLKLGLSLVQRIFPSVRDSIMVMAQRTSV